MLPHATAGDDREPAWILSLPPALSGGGEPIVRVGLLRPSLLYWLELLGLLLATLGVAALLGRALYRTVVRPGRAGTLPGHLIGFGAILPFWALWPVLVDRVVDLQNAFFRFLIGGIAPIVCTFRTVETVCGLCPSYVTRSEGDFCFYYATVPMVKRIARDANGAARPRAGDPVPASRAQILRHLATFLGLTCATGALQSVLMPHPDMNVFGMGDDVSWRSPRRLATWQLYANSALQALLFQLCLATYFEALMFAFALLTGCAASPCMDNPLLASASPMDFWGRRWNTLIHQVLKNGVYKPLRQAGAGRNAAVLATFLASGLFHEWILWLVFALGSRGAPLPMGYGGSLVFFVWQALLIGLELAVGGTALVQSASRRLPTPLRTALVVAAGILPAHFFLEPYLVGERFFQHGALGLPMVVRL